MLRTSLAVVVLTSLMRVAIAGDAPATPTTPSSAPAGAPADPAAPANPSEPWTGALPAPPPETAPQPAPPAPPPASGPPSTTYGVLNPPPPKSTVMDRRWSIGLGFGWETLTIKHGENQKVTFGM